MLKRLLKSRGGGGMPIPILKPEKALEMEFDKIIISNLRVYDIVAIEKQLQNLGIEKSKITPLSYYENLHINYYLEGEEDEFFDARIIWLKQWSDYVHWKHLSGNVAECGVFRGRFAHFINKYFSDRKFYMFDSFEGFQESDIKANLDLKDESFNASCFNETGHFSNTNIEIVMNKMLYPDKCEIHKGYIPESAVGIKDEFCFVNLDMDLYQPMFEGLKIFYPMMVKGGVILMHDYFHEDLATSVQKALEDYETFIGHELCKIPIGDFISIAVIKN